MKRTYTPGTLFVDVYTDLQADDPINTDYMALGLWMFVPHGAVLVADGEVGVFTKVTDPFSSQNIQGLTGQATYKGPAHGLYTVHYLSPGSSSGFQFDADVELTAEFGGPHELGTISGRLVNFSSRSEIDFPLVPELRLGQAPIRSLTDDENGAILSLPPETPPPLNRPIEGGSFEGEVIGYQVTTGNYSGSWRGQFAGNGVNSIDHPSSVVGEFGASLRNDPRGVRANLIGTFGAYKQ